MSDVADMLGIQTNKPAAPLNAAEEAVRFLQEANKAKTDNKGSKPIKKPKGMKREVYDLLGKDGIVPALQSNPVGPVFKNKRSVATRGRWIYAPIESSARAADNNQLTFFHWVKADINYPDYPYAKFNIHLEAVTFTDEEYSSHLNDDNWSKDDTETVLDVSHNLDLRWPIIFDRIQLSTHKTPEEIQARYYAVVNKLQTVRDQQALNGIPSLYEKKTAADFDLEKESKRRLQQDLLFKRTREEEQEELKVREELKAIDSMLKKNKKTVKTSTASNSSITINIAPNPTIPPPPPLISQPSDATISALPVGSSSGAVAPGEIGGITLATVTNPLPDINPTPQVNRPCLQSSRLFLTENTLPLAKSMVGKMNSYLKEISIPERPVPTKRVCDLVDQIRKDTITLISLHNTIKKKEKELFLAKGGTIKNVNKNAPKVKTEKQTKGGGTGASRKKTTDNKNSASTNANNTDTVNQAFDESAVDNSFNGDLLPLDGKEDIGDLLEVFDGNDSFHDMDMIKTENAASSKSASKKRGRSTKDKAGDDGAGAEDGSAAGGAAAVAANPPKKKSKKST